MPKIKKASATTSRTIPVLLRLQPQQLAKLDKLAQEGGVTRSSAIKTGIARLIKQGL